MTLQEIVDLLASTAIFQGMSKTAFQSLAPRAVVRRLKKSEALFNAGDQARGLHVVVSGAVRAYRCNEDGREQTLHVERAGGTMTEVPLFDDGPYPSTAQAEEDSVVLFLAKEDVRNFMLQHPEAALSALRLLSMRLRRVASLAESFALEPVSQRLVTALEREARQQGTVLQDGATFRLALTNQQLATRIGTGREVVNRMMQKMLRARVLERKDNLLVVRSAQALREFGRTGRPARAAKRGIMKPAL